MNIVLGIDLSLAGLGLVAAPENWGGDWSRIARATLKRSLRRGAPERDRIARIIYLADGVIEFARKHGATTAIFEEYAFSQGDANARAIAEVGGVVKVYLANILRIPVETIHMNTARKLAVGTVPRQVDGKKVKAKDYVRTRLTAMGMPPEWTMDEGDAFVAMNAKQSEIGGCAIVTRVEETKRTRRKAA
jgi:hypothetical protein